MSEQGSLDCPLQGFTGTYLPPSLADREQGCPLGARSLAFGTGNIQGGHQEEPRPRGHQLYGRAQIHPAAAGSCNQQLTLQRRNPIVPALQGSGIHGKSLFQAESCFMGTSVVTMLSRRERSQLRLRCFSYGPAGGGLVDGEEKAGLKHSKCPRDHHACCSGAEVL